MAGTVADARWAMMAGWPAPPVMATTGGAGTYRILDGIDVDAFCADPKPIVGFSDIGGVVEVAVPIGRTAVLDADDGSLIIDSV